MHELNLAMAIVEMAEEEAKKNNAGSVHQIELEVGVLSGVDPDALELALSLAVKNTAIEQASVTMLLTEGFGRCNACDHTFTMTEVCTPCPLCNMPAGKILQGTELKLLSLTVDDL